MRRRLLLIAMLATACTTTPKRGFGPDAPQTETGILAAARAAIPRPRSIRGFCEVELEGGGTEFSADGLCIVERGGRVYIELDGPLGIGAAALALDGRRLELMDGLNEVRYSGDPTRADLARVTGIALSPAALCDLLLLPGTEATQTATRVVDPPSWLLRGEWRGRDVEWRLHPATMQIERFMPGEESALRSGGAWRAAYSEHTPAGWPRRVEIATERARLTLTWEDWEFDAALGAADFALPATARGMRRLPLSALGGAPD